KPRNALKSFAGPPLKALIAQTMTSYLAGSQAFQQEKGTSDTSTPPPPPQSSINNYRGVRQHLDCFLKSSLSLFIAMLTLHGQATVEDLDPPPALSTSPHSSIISALQSAYERDYTHLTVVSSSRQLLGYLSIPRLRELLQQGKVKESDSVGKAMLRFRRKGNVYTKITMNTPLEDLEKFFDGVMPDGTQREKQNFAVVTDEDRKFVLGVATVDDLHEFVKRRPCM
ncbi:hypothetical protein KEM55_007136, partial [Ascosphaera atra]